MADPTYDPNDGIPLQPDPRWPSGNADESDLLNWSNITKTKDDLVATSNNTLCMNPNVLAHQSAEWVPEMSGWSVEYDDQGLASCTQSWIAPASARVSISSNPLVTDPLIPITMATRQLVSWNREMFAASTHFFDTDYNLSDYIFPSLTANGGTCSLPGKPIAKNLMIPLVPVQVELVPRIDLMDASQETSRKNETIKTAITVFSRIPARDSALDSYSGSTIRDEGNYLGVVRSKMLVSDPPTYNVDGTQNPAAEIRSVRQVFPRLRTQYFQVNIQFKRDPYVNRYGIRYANVEVKPSTRLQAMKNAPVGVVPTDIKGQPHFDRVYEVVSKEEKAAPPVQKGAAIIEHIDTGFPFRESLVEYRVTYPWVSLDSLLKAGPIGNPDQITMYKAGLVTPYELSKGMWLGSVNLHSFLGYSRGRVLYNSCEIEEAASPVTGKIGYKVTHEFIANPAMEWNQVRYNGSYEPSKDPLRNAVNDWDPNTAQPAWRTGYVVALNKNPIFTEDYMSGGESKKRSMYDPIWTYKRKADEIVVDGAIRHIKRYPLYPYPYQEFYKDQTDTGLLYYGYVGDAAPLAKIRGEG